MCLCIVPETVRKIVEVGAPNFFKDDECLGAALESTGLAFRRRYPSERWKDVGLWNGQGTVAGPFCNLESLTWKHLARLIARYGISAWRLHQTIASMSKKWKMLGAVPFDNIGQATRDADLEDALFGPAETYLRELGISPKFLSEFVEPCTRARFAHNLNNASAFSALMAVRRAEQTTVMGGDGIVDGGNARLIERLIDLSGADLRLNSTVREIRDGDTRRYRVSVASSPGMNSNLAHAEYDAVILAVPLHNGSINLDVASAGRSIDLLASRLHDESHVTHFSAPTGLSPAIFHPLKNARIPQDLLTTAQSSNILSTSRSRVCYYRYCLPDDDCDQCDEDDKMHRVTSRRLLSDSDIVDLVGKQLREGLSLADIGISWVHRKAWSQALPTLNRTWIGEAGRIEIAPELFYTGGMERMLSLMELSCRMGRNVARLLSRLSIDDMDISHLEL